VYEERLQPLSAINVLLFSIITIMVQNLSILGHCTTDVAITYFDFKFISAMPVNLGLLFNEEKLLIFL
jgi:hypothetical protein